ncbi:hypothetical protein HAZT_HAZT003389 [Hyalella azteca]|uniref:Nipped-B protein n=1 Tax=Hyalella azteca TaxID=294128 RepID=A0A6A0H431_HYAAZ|nr:hypothetical protein HAZT_HAZT003389 [Hyalella azteca]
MFLHLIQRTPLKELLYIADNLAYFPYQVLDEALFVIYHIDLMISTMGSNLLQAFREALLPPPDADVKYNPETGRPEYLDDDADDDSASLLTRCPVDMSPLLDSMQASQGCLLLLVLKEYLKEVYGITDGSVFTINFH